MQYQLFRIKNYIENIFIYPFILTGRVLFAFSKKQPAYELYFFFPFYHTGGAEKVHALIAQATGGTNAVIYFTRHSNNRSFYNEFVKAGCVIKDISKYTDSKLFYFANLVYRGYVSAIINSQSSLPLVFNGQCNFGYKISPWINSSIPQVELIHSFNTFSWIRIPFLPYITRTVMISKVRIQDHLQQYERLSVPKKFNKTIQYIINGVDLPAIVGEKELTGKIKILYVGRGTKEKRVYLVAEIAKRCIDKNLPVRFQFMGEVQDAIPKQLLPYCEILGDKSNPDEINTIYQQAHIIIITSTTEGFPMVIEEGMATGCAVMATPVGDIPVHVQNNQHGFLFTSITNEETIITEAVTFISAITRNRPLLQKLSEENIEYSARNFGIKTFTNSYKTLFSELRSKTI